MLLSSIFEVWDKLPRHAKIIIAVTTVIATLVRPTLSLIKWLKDSRKKTENGGQSRDIDTLTVPFSIKISPHSRKIRWYKDKIRNHNLFFQLDELIKYEIDTNRFSFGDQERTRLFRQLMRIYLGVLSDVIRKPLDNKLNLDKLKDKEISELFSDFIQETNYLLYNKFKENFTSEFFNLVIMDEEKGFVHFVEKHKKALITQAKDIIGQDKKLYDGTNYRKLWEFYSLIRILLNVGLDLYMEFYDQFNGDLDKIIKK